MDFFGAIIGGLLTTVTYIVIFFGVYKLVQIATDIHEIKDLVANGRRAPSAAAPPAPIGLPALTSTSSNLAAEDSAAAYAEHLLRAVNAEQRTSSAPQEVR